MTFEKRNIGFFLIFLILGGILGSAIGTLIVKFFPAVSIIKNNLTEPIGFNVEIISFHIKLNLSAIIGLIVGFIIFRRI